MKKYSIFLILLFCGFSSRAAKVEEIKTFSRAMNKEIPAIVITPDSYPAKGALPVVYLLHGHGGTYKTGWGKEEMYVKRYADIHNIILVLADGGKNSWYFDSLVDQSVRYETYICKELIPAVDAAYRTISSREGRAITGLSMGGHGALYLAFRHQDLFGAAGSTSGGVDFRPWPLKWGLSERLGSYSENPEVWDSHTVINLVHLLTPGSVELIIDCGTEDFFYGVNEEFHRKLLKHNIPHDYIVRPGKHVWAYWKNSITYQLTFMAEYFNKPHSAAS